MPVLKYFDIFDVKFNLYTENQPIHHSAFGGIMTILFIIISCVSVFYFEHDEFFKQNLVSSVSEITYGYENVKKKLSEEKVWVPFRMVTYEGKYIDHRNILFPMIYAVKGKRNGGDELKLNYTKLNYKLCNETSMINKTDNYIIDVKLNELFCIDDNSDDMIGGSWTKEELYYIEIDLYLCKNGIDYDELNPNCTKLEDLFKYHNTSWLFEFYYPIVQYQPLNKTVPIDVVYKAYYYRLTKYAGKIERIYLKQNILSDDQNIIGNNPKNLTFWSTSSSYGDTYFLPTDKDFLVKSTTSRLYSLTINKDPGLTYYKRSYKKILDILSDIFPVLNIIYIICKKVTEKMKMSFIKRNLMELLFEKKFILNMAQNNKVRKAITTIEKIPKTQYPYNNLQQQRGSIKLVQNSINKFIINNNSMLGDCNDIINERSLHNINMNNNKPIAANSLKLNIFSNYYLNDVEDNRNQKIKKKEITITKKINDNELYKKKLFPISYYFMDSLLDRFIKPKKFIYISKKYLIVYNFMNQLYDISTYILLYKQLQLLKITLDRNQNLIMNEYAKMNIKNGEFMDNLDNVLQHGKFPIFSDIVFNSS